MLAKLKEENYLKDCNKEQTAKRLAYYISEINVIHSFREGNGRTQRLFIEHLADTLGYYINFNLITGDEMLEASVRAFGLDYSLMEEILSKAICEKENDENDKGYS